MPNMIAAISFCHTQTADPTATTMVPMRHLFVAFVCAAACLLPACAAESRRQKPSRVLFVGNSLTYVGNLPAVFDALADSNGKHVESDMIVKGGATLTDRVADGTVQRALAEKHYAYVILQERGGDLLCSFGPMSCIDANKSLSTLARVAHAHDTIPLYLGTYQGDPAASTDLVEKEAAAAKLASIAYIPLSDSFQEALASEPTANWLYADGMHPGHDLILLEAVLIYHRLFGALPEERAFSVTGPMYAPNAKFSLPSPTSRSASAESVVSEHTYDATIVAVTLKIAKDCSP